MNRKLKSVYLVDHDKAVLRFHDISFSICNGQKKKSILRNICGEIEAGHVLALLGPSGAGKSTLISALTLDAVYGKTTGCATLNGEPLSADIIRKDCFVVKQQDRHWEYLTARQNLTYAAEFYDITGSAKAAKDTVNNLIFKMGLSSCADIASSKLSGGQRRRLSLAIGILKKPKVLFLDEPTSGLDAASATRIMEEIIRVAREESLIILCSIHQPSTKIYNGFDQVMILSMGQQAYFGNAADAAPYFNSIGYPMPIATNPAEHFLDLINADFSSEEEVLNILEKWDESKPSREKNQLFGDVTESTMNNSTGSHSYHNFLKGETPTSLDRQVMIMLRRQANLVIRDPTLYLGRILIFLGTNTVFALVYWKGRNYVQSAALAKTWVSIWFIAVPTNMGVVAVYSLNEEFKIVQREVKNGMVSVLSYIIVKTTLVIPIFFFFAMSALGIPSYVIALYPVSTLGRISALWAAMIYYCECVAECLAALFDNPIIGMLYYIAFWFCSFLFNGFLIAKEDLYIPFNVFYYILPQGFYLRSLLYLVFVKKKWEPCTDISFSAVCLNTTDGKEVLGALSLTFPIIRVEDSYFIDLGSLLGLALVWKLIGILVMLIKTKNVSSIVNETKPLASIPRALVESIPKLMDIDISGSEVSKAPKSVDQRKENEISCQQGYDI